LKPENSKKNELKYTNLKTINGVKKINGMIALNVKIFEVEKKINVFVIDEENFDYEFLIGLDCIKNFHLTQDKNLRISQKIPNKKQKIISQKTENSSLKKKKFSKEKEIKIQ